KAAIDGNGNELDNRLVGNGAANKLNGNNGIDSLLGGAGNDTLTAGDINDVNDFDLLDGGSGADLMTGSDNGVSLFFVDNVGDKVLGTTGEVRSSVTFDLQGTGVENLVLTGNSAISGFGSAEANFIAGNGAANKLNGLDAQDFLLGNGGNDTLDGGQSDGFVDELRGGAGNDLYLVGTDLAIEELAGAAGGIDTVVSVVDFTLGANIENLTLSGAAFLGTGNNLANIIIGSDGDNIIDGKGGADKMIGGKGDDAYHVDSTGDTITELAGGGTADEVRSEISYVLGAELEILLLIGGSSKGTGNANANILVGGAGNDTLDGKGGGDDLDGRGGDDTLIVDNLGDTTSDSVDGIDLVLSSVSHAIGAGIENLTLIGKAANGTGNDLANELTGNGAANSLSGGVGNDTLTGGAGNDTLTGGKGEDVFHFLGGVGKDTITDFLTAGDNDVIDIADMLTGYVEGVSNVNDFVQLAFTGGDAILRVDANGLAGGSKFIDVAVIAGGVNQTVTELVAGGNLVVT
ncbi:MAG TPA: calcium-binding protein, partial [Dongiaceae bacterium]